MEMLIWLGAAVTLAGLALLVWCILRVIRARRAGLSDDDLRATLQKILPVNTGALFLSVIGLMLVVLGIVLS
ncbi:hypothetical protein PVV74_18160 [Roseovarius sp. SK2]|jgi:uncharacterized membrane protein|uniref:hypothetical protein n=1 Tax=Roseovarius TaxID=74030 RepID=UPI000CDD639F|nr:MULTISPECIES: hypothetical protein [Roseovarius]MDD9727387.1 hypothetical protein [Roseovarius sp. SK2]QFT93388.1 hypothetical protein FIU86_11105 [Roseovarius sp. THAF9]